MSDYIPFKYSNKRLSKNNKNFKALCDSFKPEPYRLKDEGTHRFGNVRTARPTKEVMPLVTGLYEEKFSKLFPNQYNSSKIILRTYEAVMHRDPNWNSNLFLSVVLHAANKGHVLCGSRWSVPDDNNLKSTSIFLRQGDVFLLDPFSLHSVHSTSRIKSELILLQFELELGTRDMVEKVMAKCPWESVGINKD